MSLVALAEASWACAQYKLSSLYEYGGSATEWAHAAQTARRAEAATKRAKARELRRAQQNSAEIAEWFRLEA